MSKYTYSKSGVDIDKGNKFIENIKKTIKNDKTKSSKASVIGGFAGLYKLNNIKGNPYLVAATDGVGTKIIIAELMDRYDTIGIDCVAMNVNDLICVGARPVSMVDYIGCSFTDARIFSEIGKGLAEGARQGEISISGGEISQIKEIINGVDLIGACIGHVSIDKINTGKDIEPGNIIIGLASSGVHSNGLTLARKILLGETREEQEKNVNKFEERLGRTLGEELLEPTRIYVKPVMEMLEADISLKAMVHITSGGYSNLNRVENNNIRFVIDQPPEVPEVFKLIQERGEVSDAEMYEVFNMGTGFIVVVNEMEEVKKISAICKKHDIVSQIIGCVELCKGKEVTLPEFKLLGRGQKIKKLK